MIPQVPGRKRTRGNGALSATTPAATDSPKAPKQSKKDEAVIPITEIEEEIDVFKVSVVPNRYR